jgi:hypothetical protein
MKVLKTLCGQNAEQLVLRCKEVMAEHKFKLLVHKVKLLKRLYEQNQKFVGRVLFQVCVLWNGYGLKEAQRIVSCTQQLDTACFRCSLCWQASCRGERTDAGSALSSATVRVT